MGETDQVIGSAAPESYGRRLTSLAAERGQADAVVFAADDGSEVPISWAELERRANQVARLLVDRGVAEGDLVVVGLRNSPEHLYATFGAWKAGAAVLPLRWDLPDWERERMLAVADARVVVGDWGADDLVRSDDVRATTASDGTPLPEDRVPKYSRLVATSGSTGTPKIIVTPSPAIYDPAADAARALTTEVASVTLTTSPLYHTNGFGFSYPHLLNGERVVLMEHFDAARAVDLIERHRVTFTVMVPTMLQRIARLEGIETRDLSSLERVVYGGASLPEWVARKWLELVPPERFVIVYGGSEGVGSTMCTGADWLDHPGTVGVPVGCEVLILDEEHRPLPVGEVGQIWMRRFVEGEPFRYVGTETPTPILDGFRSFGDMGRVDDEGFLYIADRRQDMIVTGGVNVFPAEVEAALSEHAAVHDVVVIGVADPEWGHRVHALVQPAEGAAPSEAELRDWARSRLAGYKVPKTVELVDRMPRTAAGKVNRTRLAEERSAVG